MKKNILFLTYQGSPDLNKEDQTLVKHLEEQANVIPLIWQEPLPKTPIDLAVIRTTWDYYKEPENFLKKLKEIEDRGIPLHNSTPVLEWNFNKKYLLQMAEENLPIVPTTQAKTQNLTLIYEKQIVKPLISAASFGTFIVTKENLEETKQELEKLKIEDVLIQPFRESVHTEGEFAFMYFGTSYSHAVIKKPKPKDFRVQEEHGGSTAYITPSKKDLEQSHAIAQWLEKKFPGTLYARVDMIRAPEGHLELMELELIEPFLFMSHHPASFELFASKILVCLQKAGL